VTGSIAAELVVQRKRSSTWILLGVFAALSVFFLYVLPYTDELAPDLLPEGVAGNVIRIFPVFGGVFALMLGVLTTGSDYGWDTVKTLFTQGPGRLAVLAGKLLALAAVLLGFTLVVFLGGAVASLVIALVEDADVEWPSAWLLVRALAAGWFILAVWAAAGVMLAVLSRGTALAIGIAVLYALVIEGLLSALADSVGALEPVAQIFVRSNAYSIATALGASRDRIADSGPGSFTGPYVSTAQAVVVLAAYLVVFVLLTAAVLRRRDVT
jgi:ABC-type transport system involved in multi-copper enzyme maturation permease subunit